MLWAAIVLKMAKEVKGRDYSGSSLLWLDLAEVPCTTSWRHVLGGKL